VLTHNSLKVLERYRAILNPDPDPERQEELHLQDCDTTWIGIDQEDNVPVFQNYGRYQTIMADSLTKEVGTRYPQIVSFIGQTGAGKSTVVKMLIDHQRALRKSSVRSFDSPVVSSLDSNVPTSADVHLYSDPGTWDQSRPVLYADCEGLEGGEIDPLAVKYRTAERNIGAHAVKKATLKKIHKVARSTRLDWATSPEKRRRQFAVTELYPRILYTFSDVIVFVLRNSKYVRQGGESKRSNC
jgi:energy-coupling factor transporter ATP-binding protein EcfA2